MSNEIRTITKLAKELATKELENDSTANQQEILDALDAVAKLLKNHAGQNTQIKDLANQVEVLVANKKGKLSGE